MYLCMFVVLDLVDFYGKWRYISIRYMDPIGFKQT